jgi:hypothetical protein
MGLLLYYLGRPFERACRLSQTSRGTAIFKILGENTKLSLWVKVQRSNNRLHLQAKPSPSMTTFRIQAFGKLTFRMGLPRGPAWEDRLSEFADFRRIHGHCNVPYNYSKNTKLTRWVITQMTNYNKHRQGKTSSMTTYRIQALERLGFELAFESDGPRARCPIKYHSSQQLPAPNQLQNNIDGE